MDKNYAKRGPRKNVLEFVWFCFVEQIRLW